MTDATAPVNPLLNPLWPLRRRIEEGLPHIEITVRELLDLFHAKRRGAWIVEEISSALESSKLTTDPDFRDSWIDGVVLVKPQLRTEADDSPVAGESEHWKSDDSDGDARREPLNFKTAAGDPVQRVRMLPAANKQVAFVAPDDDISIAITTMMKDDYSQLSVQTGERTVKGVVSWKSIASRIALGLDHSKVRNCIEPHREVPADESLFDVISTIAAHGYVLVRAPDQRISGIITASDLSE